MEHEISWNARTLGVQLGLGDLVTPAPCMGYANACVCAACVVREELWTKQRRVAPFPWELDAA